MKCIILFSIGSYREGYTAPSCHSYACARLLNISLIPSKMPANSERRVQVVSTMSQKKYVILWMTETVNANVSDHIIAAKAVQQFPSIFTQRNPRANREKERQ